MQHGESELSDFTGRLPIECSSRQHRKPRHLEIRTRLPILLDEQRELERFPREAMERQPGGERLRLRRRARPFFRRTLDSLPESPTRHQRVIAQERAECPDIGLVASENAQNLRKNDTIFGQSDRDFTVSDTNSGESDIQVAESDKHRHCVHLGYIATASQDFRSSSPLSSMIADCIVNRVTHGGALASFGSPCSSSSLAGGAFVV